MAEFVPILFRQGGGYLIRMSLERKGSSFQELEYLPREFLELVIKKAATHGHIIRPYVLYGFH